MDDNKHNSPVNLNSVDAMFATIISDGRHLKELLMKRSDDQDKILEEIKIQTLKTNGRVNALENFRDSILAKVSGFILAVSGVGAVLVWVFEHVLQYFSRPT